MTDPSPYLKQMSLVSDDDTYRIIRLPANGITVAAGILAEVGEPFAALVVDKNEVTLILEAEALEEYQQRLRDHRVEAAHYRLITLDVVLESNVVGFFAHISSALAAANVPIFAFSAFSRDHLLVEAAHFERAMQALNNVKAEAAINTQAKGG